MRFALMLNSHSGPAGTPLPGGIECASFYEELIDDALLAESLGFDGAFVPERHARSETVCADPLMMLMAMAARTERIALGTFVMMPPLYNPAHLAEAAAAVDSVSRGRLILGFGAGYHQGYFDQFGLPFEDRGARLDESVAFLQKAWQGERFDWSGDIWQMNDVLVTPRPFDDGGPPLWFAGTSPKPLRRAGTKGDGVALHSVMTPLAKMREWVDIYREAAADAGRKPVVAVTCDGYVGVDDDEAGATFQPFLDADNRADFYLKHGMIREDEIVTERTLEYDTLFVGGTEQVAAKLAAFEEGLELGPDDWFLFNARTMWGPKRQQMIESMERFAGGVIPLLNGGAK